MNEMYIKILAQRAKVDSTLLDKLPEDVRVEVEKYLEYAQLGDDLSRKAGRVEGQIKLK